MDIFNAPEATREVALFFVHGGGWRGGSRTIFHSIIHEYSRRGFDCASTDYRLSGVNVFDQVGDVRIGLDIFAGELKKRNCPARVLLIGSSAGAHLALLAALAKPEECGAPETPLVHECEIAGVAVQAAPFTFEPWPDIFPGSWEAMQSAVGAPCDGNEVLYRQSSPMNYIRSGNPPLFALHAENEHMFPLDIAAEFARRSIALGNVVKEKIYPRTEHGFFYSIERRQQCEAFDDILEFAESVTTRSHSGVFAEES
jgi:acetyl esterase/lipase